MGALAVLLCVTVLCVAVFGALTLVTAAGDLRMARRTGEYTRSWYDLENQGQLWCSQIRRVSRVPVIFLSSAADNLNQVMALSLGADDFIAKPFDLDLLLAKIQALLRRTYEFGGEGRLIQHRGAVLDLDSASLTYGGRRAELTKNEFGILRILMENRGRTVSREDLMSRLWQTDCYVDENTLTVNVARLRRKLEGLGLTDFILTKKGMGYLVE